MTHQTRRGLEGLTKHGRPRFCVPTSFDDETRRAPDDQEDFRHNLPSFGEIHGCRNKDVPEPPLCFLVDASTFTDTERGSGKFVSIADRCIDKCRCLISLH